MNTIVILEDDSVICHIGLEKFKENDKIYRRHDDISGVFRAFAHSVPCNINLKILLLSQFYFIISLDAIGWIPALVLHFVRRWVEIFRAHTHPQNFIMNFRIKFILYFLYLRKNRENSLPFGYIHWWQKEVSVCRCTPFSTNCEYNLILFNYLRMLVIFDRILIIFITSCITVYFDKIEKWGIQLNDLTLSNYHKSTIKA